MISVNPPTALLGMVLATLFAYLRRRRWSVVNVDLIVDKAKLVRVKAPVLLCRILGAVTSRRMILLSPTNLSTLRVVGSAKLPTLAYGECTL